MQDPDIIALHHTLDLITFEYYSTNSRVLTRLKERESKTRFSTLQGSVCENISLPVGVIDSVESEKKNLIFFFKTFFLFSKSTTL